MSGRMLSEKLGKAHFWLMIVGFNLTFFVQHILGMLGMPRRVFTYPDLPGWATLNLLSTVGAVIMGVAALVFVANLVVSLRSGKLAGDNPWEAWTLEWATTSPPSPHNFERVPPVHGRRPLWDLAHPEEAEEAKKLAATEKEEKPPPDKFVVGVVAFIASEAAFFVILILTYVIFNLSTAASKAALDVQTTGLFTACLLASSGTFHMAEKALSAGNRQSFRTWLAVTLALGGVFMGGQAREYVKLLSEGLTVNKSLFASTFFTLTGFHGLHVTLGLVAIGILVLMASGGKLKDKHAAVKSIGLYWHFVDVVWVAVFSIVYLRNLL
jgi:heme/copper-type cytochrome/quinol oxidase subunit 3